MSETVNDQKSPSPVIEVDNLVRYFGDRAVLNGISFKVFPGETLIIMGGSGCGKSTLLKHLIGSLKPSSGTIRVFGQNIETLSDRELIPIRRQFGMLFQYGALLESHTVGENVALPIREHSDVSPDIIDLMVKMKLELVGLTGFEDFKPSEISGGMRKRVAMARALALDPKLLFSDEPTSGLDPVMTAVVDELTSTLTEQMGMTAVIITHDMTSAFRIGSRMIMLGTGDRQGKIVAEGTPEEIRTYPDPMLQQFIKGEADGPIPLRLSKGDYLRKLIGETDS